MDSTFLKRSIFKARFLRYALLTAIVSGGVASFAHAQSAFDDPGGRAAAGKAGDLRPVADKVEAGNVSLGSSSQIVVLFRNDDVKPVKTDTINLYPSSNVTASVADNQCEKGVIAPSEVCAISVQVQGLQKGAYRIEMLMRHNGRTKLLTTTINGNVESTGDASTDMVSDIEAIPSSVDFGDLEESRSQVKAVILRNKTSKPIEIGEISVEAGAQSGYSVSENCKTLAVGAACVAAVTWTPAQPGPSTGTLVVRHSGPTEVTAIELIGQYDPEEFEKASVFPNAVPGKGLLISSAETVDFGTGITQSSSITVSMVNVGDMPLTLTDIRMSNAESGIRAEKTGCRAGQLLAPLEACPLTMTWEPVREGAILDDVQIAHTGARGVLVLPLRGTAARAVNKDLKPITFGGTPGPEAILRRIQPLSLDEFGDDVDEVIESGEKATGGKASKKRASALREEAPPEVDVRGVLDGYAITSFSQRRAIVSGPGGSRVVFDGEETVIGGILWTITMRPNAIEFTHGTQKVLLLFDRSLSSVNLVGAQSNNAATAAASSASAVTP